MPLTLRQHLYWFLLVEKGDENINRAANLFRIGEFADRAGVTVRTVRYYDRIGLLKPSGHSEAGQRLYNQFDYARLQQILTLKLIGLSLEQIKSLLTTDISAIHQLLEQQKSVLEQQIRQLSLVIQTIEGAQSALNSSPTLDWEQFVNIIKAVNMQTRSDWFSQFMTAEQKDRLAELSQHGTLADQKQAGRAWKDLFQAIRENMDKAISDPMVQQLVDRWDDLMAEFTRIDPDFAARLNAAYAHIDTVPGVDTAPQEVQNWAQGLREAARFIETARAARNG